MTAPVMVMAGGTGGHVFPGLAVAAALQARSVPVVWLGARGGMEERLVPSRGIVFEGIAVRGLRGKGLWRKLALPLDLLRAVWQAHGVLKRTAPRCVVSFGGYAAGPGGLAAALGRMPLVVHEQNRIPGLTNRVLARLARRVLSGFPDVFAGGQWVGNPVRAEIASLPAPNLRFAARSGPLNVLVLGGSQGARVLNQTLPAALALLEPGLRPNVWHQCGQAGLEATTLAYQNAGVAARVTAFIDDMAAAYAWADLAVCRAGALTLAELTAAGLGAWLVPYPHAVDDHQTANARWLVDAGAAELIPESGLSAELLAQRLRALGTRAELQAMAERARALAAPDSADRVAATCIEVSA